MPAPTPPLIVEAFGINAGPSFISPIPVPSQIGINPGRASYNDGFVPLNTTPKGSGGVPPDIRDQNGILNEVSANIAASTGGQYWPFNATWSTANGGYAVGAIVAMSAGNGFWINSVANNTSNPDSSPAATSGWSPLCCAGTDPITGLTTGSVVLTAVQAAPSFLILKGALTGSVTLQLPPWGRVWYVSNQVTGSGSLQVIMNSTGAGNATIPRGGIAIVAVDTSGNTIGTLSASSFNSAG